MNKGSITWADILKGLPLVAVFTAIVLTWGSTISNQGELKVQVGKVDDKVEKVKEAQSDMKIQIAEMRQALKSNGIISRNYTPVPVVAQVTTPTPAPTSVPSSSSSTQISFAQNPMQSPSPNSFSDFSSGQSAQPTSESVPEPVSAPTMPLVPSLLSLVTGTINGAVNGLIK